VHQTPWLLNPAPSKTLMHASPTSIKYRAYFSSCFDTPITPLSPFAESSAVLYFKTNSATSLNYIVDFRTLLELLALLIDQLISSHHVAAVCIFHPKI
jgi:hypothetical protein